eukprot:gene22845-29019_t
MEVYQKNFMSASHLLLKSWKKYHTIGQQIEQLKQTMLDNTPSLPLTPEKPVDNASLLVSFPSSDFNKSSRSPSPANATNESVATAPVAMQEPEITPPPLLEEVKAVDETQDIIQSLEAQIAAKTKEIRTKQSDRRGAVSEEVLELTKDLLQLKQLFRDLKGSWKSSDGHQDVVVLTSQQRNTTSNKYFIGNVHITVQPPSVKQAQAVVTINPVAAGSTDVVPLSQPTNETITVNEPSTPPAHNAVKQLSFRESPPPARTVRTPSKSPLRTTPLRQSANKSSSKSSFTSPVSSGSHSKTAHQQQRTMTKYRQNEDTSRDSDDEYGSEEEGEEDSQADGDAEVDECGNAICTLNMTPKRNTANTNTSGVLVTPKSDYSEMEDKENSRPSNRVHNQHSGLKDKHHHSSLMKVKAHVRTSPPTHKTVGGAHHSSMSTLPDVSNFTIPTVHVLLPGLPDFFSYFMSSGNALAEPKKRSILRNTNTANNTRKSGMSNRRNSSGGRTPKKFIAQHHSNNQLNNTEKYVIQYEARLHFATGVFSLLGSLIPAELSWILALVNCPVSVLQGVKSLYSVHQFKEGMWSHLASLLLLNLPYGVISSALSQDCASSELGQLPMELRQSIDCPDQFYALLEAQSMVHVSRNPLFQWTLARNNKVNSLAIAGSCLNYRIDRYRRAQKACVQGMSGGRSFFVELNLAKCCLFSGEWEAASSEVPAFTRIESNQQQFTHKVVSIAASLALHTLNTFKTLQQQYIYDKVTNNMARTRNSELSFEMSRSRLTQSDIANGVVATNGNTARSDRTEKVSTNAEGDRNYSSLLDVCSKFSTSVVSEKEVVLRERMHTYLAWGRTFNQSSGCGKTILQMMASVFRGDADLWLWLLPAEMTYLSFRHQGGNEAEMVSEANHVKMLQALDQGAVMFADNVLVAGTVHDEDEKNPYRVLAQLVNGLVLSDLANRDSAVVQMSINPKSALEIYSEKSFLNGTSTLRLKCIPRPKTSESSVAGSGTNIYSIIREIKDKTKSITQSIGFKHSSETSPKNAESLTGLQVAGDIVLCYLLLRGLILVELGKAWEAALMFNLVDSLQMFATLSKFAPVAANYHLAEVVLNFAVCDRPLEAATEYLHRASSALSQSGTRGKVYTSEYCKLIQDLVAKMER